MPRGCTVDRSPTPSEPGVSRPGILPQPILRESPPLAPIDPMTVSPTVVLAGVINMFCGSRLKCDRATGQLFCLGICFSRPWIGASAVFGRSTRRSSARTWAGWTLCYGKLASWRVRLETNVDSGPPRPQYRSNRPHPIGPDLSQPNLVPPHPTPLVGRHLRNQCPWGVRRLGFVEAI